MASKILIQQHTSASHLMMKLNGDPNNLKEGNRNATDLVRDVRVAPLNFYLQEKNPDQGGNRAPFYFMQDTTRFQYIKGHSDTCTRQPFWEQEPARKIPV